MDEQIMQELADAEQRCIELEKLVADCLAYMRETMPYAYAVSHRCVELQDRAAALDIIPDVKGDKR